MAYLREEENLITLDSFEKLSYKVKYALLFALENSEPDFAKNKNGLIKILGDGVYNKVVADYNSQGYREKVLKELEKKGITCVTVFSGNYPALLREIPCPPLVLYCKGNIKLLNTRCFSIVGSRRTPANVFAECKKFARELSKRFTIVTGMADGADSAAVMGALDGGNLISVLAYGFDYVYPAVNEGLIKSVAEEGLLVSEYVPTTGPRNYLFPERNRIIAGLSEGTLVVSAGAKSGALITADYAEEYSRRLFAFPYGIGASSGEGCNKLIKMGAYLTDSLDDIYGVFGIDKDAEAGEDLTKEEGELLKSIRAAGEAFVPALAEELGVPPFKLIPVLTSLEIKGKIVRLGGNRYSAV